MTRPLTPRWIARFLLLLGWASAVACLRGEEPLPTTPDIAAFAHRVTTAGTWQQDQGRLRQTDLEQVSARTLLSDSQGIDSVVSVRVRIDATSKDPWAGLRIIVRADDQYESYFTVGLCLPAQEIRIEHGSGQQFRMLQQSMDGTGPQQGAAAAWYPLRTGETYHVTVVADGAALHCYIDDQPVVTAGVENFWTHPNGKVGFYAARATGEFSELSIAPLKDATHSPFRMYEKNPLNINARSPSIIRDGATYKMWFDSARDGSDLGYAESSDGLTWTEPEGEVLTGFRRGTPGQWADLGKNDAEVLKLGNRFWIFYPAMCSVTPGLPTWWNGMGLQFSDDGRHWTPYEHNPCFHVGPRGAWDDSVVGDHAWIKDGDRHKLWYTGINRPERGYRNEFGYAESPDGIHWKKCRLNPILRQGERGDWDAGWLSCAAVIKLGDDELASGVYRGKSGGSYHLFYTGWPTNEERLAGGSRIGYAFSLDGVHWVKYHHPDTTALPYRHSEPVLNWTEYGQWGCAGYHSCALLQEGDEVRMWTWAEGPSQGTWRLGLATAKVRDLLAIVAEAKRDGRLQEFNREQIDAVMEDGSR